MSETSADFALPVRKTLRKPFEIPHADGWKIADSSVFVSSQILCCYKSRGLFWNSKSRLAERRVTFLKSGHLLIYVDENEGFVLDLRAAKWTSIRTRRATKWPAKCDVKVKFSFGSVHLHLLESEIPVWRRALEKCDEMAAEGLNTISADLITVYPSEDETTEIHSEADEMVPRGKNSSTQSLNSTENQTIMEESDEISDEIDIDIYLDETVVQSDISVTVAADSPVTEVASQVVNFDSDSGKESTGSGLLTNLEEESSETGQSIRAGYTSVAYLTEKLENLQKRGVASTALNDEVSMVEVEPFENRKISNERRPTFLQY